MINWLRKQKARRAEEKEREEVERLAEIEAVEQKGEERLAAQREAMLSKPCAVNGMQKCTDECVHFFPGNGMAWGRINGGYYFSANRPRCRLWGN